MKLNLTKDEYRLLLDLVYLGDWMVSAHDEKIDAKEPSKYEALVQKVLSCASETEFATLVERSADDGKFYTTRQFEEDGVMNIIYEYDEESFWMELIDRLAERDIRAAQPDGHLPPFKEYLELAGPIEEKYAQEFESHGLQRLQLPPEA